MNTRADKYTPLGRNPAVMRIPCQFNEAAETFRWSLGYLTKSSCCGLSHACLFIADSPLNLNGACFNQLLQLLLRVIWIAVILLCPFFSNKIMVVNYRSWNIFFDIRFFSFLHFFGLSPLISFQMTAPLYYFANAAKVQWMHWLSTNSHISSTRCLLLTVKSLIGASHNPSASSMLALVRGMKWCKGVWYKSQRAWGPFRGGGGGGGCKYFCSLGGEALGYLCEENSFLSCKIFQSSHKLPPPGIVGSRPAPI